MIVTEEADESLYWLEVCTDVGLIQQFIANALIKEADELVRIFTAISKTLKSKLSD